MILSKDGYIITNNHVIEGSEDDVPLTLKYFSNGYSRWDRIKAWFGRRFKK